MCNLYSMTRMPDAVKQLFKVSDNRATLFKPQDAIFPGYEAPVVRHAEDGARELVMMHWGFMLRRRAA
ncbi:MAG: SOS response-associated peptidase family protein [Hyphomicrobium sp.]